MLPITTYQLAKCIHAYIQALFQRRAYQCVRVCVRAKKTMLLSCGVYLYAEGTCK